MAPATGMNKKKLDRLIVRMARTIAKTDPEAAKAALIETYRRLWLQCR